MRSPAAVSSHDSLIPLWLLSVHKSRSVNSGSSLLTDPRKMPPFVCIARVRKARKPFDAPGTVKLPKSSLPLVIWPSRSRSIARNATLEFGSVQATRSGIPSALMSNITPSLLRVLRGSSGERPDREQPVQLWIGSPLAGVQAHYKGGRLAIRHSTDSQPDRSVVLVLVDETENL